jgi:hypothetical protein
MKQTKDTTEMGENRTGIEMAPTEARKTAAGAQEQATPGSEKDLVEARSRFARESRGVGSLPQPARRKAGGKAVNNGKMRLLLDKLSEREAFERTGVRLYDAMIIKVEASGEKVGPPLAELREIRAEELAHFRLVADALKELGGDSTAESPCADVTGVASRGLLQVLADPRTTLAQSLSALLTAELTDNAGWELLIQLCDALGQTRLVEAFTKALEEESDHLQKVQAWIVEDLGRKLS